ncbi:MAG: hypothetical protein SWN10_24785, partial [Pseudomonadota bacterium]|nr:hypothetical protein [Pseudomonadota bacterium]
PDADSDGLGAHPIMRVWLPGPTPRPMAHSHPKGPKPLPLTIAACAPMEWSRRRNVMGVAVPALVM